MKYSVYRTRRSRERTHADLHGRGCHPILAAPPQHLEHQREPERLAARLTESGAQRPARGRLPILHLGTERLDHGARLISQRHHDRRRRIAGLQIEFAQPIEGADRPLRARCLLPEPERDRLGPSPEHAPEQAVVGLAHQQGQLVGLGAAIDRDREPRNHDRLRVFLALDAVGTSAEGASIQNGRPAGWGAHSLYPARQLVAHDQQPLGRGCRRGQQACHLLDGDDDRFLRNRGGCGSGPVATGGSGGAPPFCRAVRTSCCQFFLLPWHTQPLRAIAAADQESRPASFFQSRAARRASDNRRRGSCRCRCRRQRRSTDAAARPSRALPAPIEHARSAPRRWRATALPRNREGRPQPGLC